MGDRPKAYVEKDMEEIIPDFFEESRNEVKSLKEALEKQDYGALKDIGHKIKGSSVTFSEGFQEMSDIGKAIELSAKENKSIDELRELVNRYADYVENVEIIYVDE